MVYYYKSMLKFFEMFGVYITKRKEELTLTEQDYLAEGVDSWNSFMLLYNSALKEMSTKVEILNDEFQHVHQYNPIEYVKQRIKTPDSIVKKLKRNGYETSIENMVKYVNDVAGIRVVCSFTSDIYMLADMIGRQNDITVVSIKDYIKNPKESGYKSYHMIVTIPIFLSDRCVDTKVEIQIRTLAMDFWANLEHKIYYKFEGNAPDYISRDLRECSAIVSMLDAKMLSLNEAILEAKRENGDDVSDESNMDEAVQVKSEDQISYLREFKAAEELKAKTQKLSKS